MHIDDIPGPSGPELDQLLEQLDAEIKRIAPTIPELNGPLDLSLLSTAQPSGVKAPEPTTPSPTLTHAATGPSKRITIRISSNVLDAIQRQAAQTRTPYQTLINDMLRSGSAGQK